MWCLCAQLQLQRVDRPLTLTLREVEGELTRRLEGGDILVLRTSPQLTPCYRLLMEGRKKGSWCVMTPFTTPHA